MSIFKTVRWCGVVVGVFFLQSNAFSQGLGNAPYSAIGLGDLMSKGYAPNNAMGDAGVSTANGFYINSLNPALLVRNRYTTFDVGVVTQMKSLQDLRQNQRDVGGNLGYLALSFPAAPKWSLGFSIKPFSSVNYQQNSYSRIGTSIYEAQYVYGGSGGLNQVAISNGFQVGKSLFLGAEARYLFGNVNRSVTSQLRIGDDRDYIVSREDRLAYQDLNFKLGSAWRQKLDKERFLNFGATYDFGTSINTNRTTTIELKSSASQPITNADTIALRDFSVKIPPSFRLGLSYERLFRTVIAFDYERQDWSKYRGINGTNDNMRVGQSYHLGIEYMPKYTSTKYWDLVFYRAGFTYHQTPIVVGTTPVNDMSVSLGIALPVGRNLANLINLSFVVGQRGSITNQTFRERYGRIVLGVSLKEQWFQKFRVD